MKKSIAVVLILMFFGLSDGPSRLFAQEESLTSAKDTLDIQEGTASVFMYFEPGVARRDHLIFSTDDSRLALFVDTYFSKGLGKDIVRIGARAGGNKRFNDSGSENFPEASIIIDNTGELENYRYAWYSPAKFPEGEWHCVAMTWQGYPDGIVKIYLDGELKGQKPYNRNYDDGRPLFKNYSVGYRPSQWVGETRGEKDLRPSTDMSLKTGGIEIKNLQFKKRCLSDSEIRGIQLIESSPAPAEDFLH